MRKTPVVLGVLSMVFGGLQVLMTGIGLASAPFSKQMIGGMGKAFSGLPKQEGQPDVGQMFDKLAKLTDELKLYTYLTGFAMLAFSITLIILGWLLYKRRAQARPFSVAWGAAALAYLPVQLWVQVKIILPRTQEVTRSMIQNMDPNASGVMQGFEGLQGTLTVAFYLICYTPFPLLLIWLMGRQSAKNDLVAVP
ncbi:MAG TPA: hypothetical protein VKQ32_11470 [Polyangia bacterium]|nr:hypothetical protein [Polyangia bacterium]